MAAAVDLRKLLESLGGGDALPALGRARVLELAWAMAEAQKLVGARLSDKEMAAHLGLSLKTFMRWVRSDPTAVQCAVVDPRPARPGKLPLRRWRAWELETHWSGKAAPRARRRTL